MNRISPVWILTTLSGNAFDSFKQEIDRQFRAFSETELIGFTNCETHQWWGVETTADKINTKWDTMTGYPNNIPAFHPNVFPLFDGDQGLVIYYSPLDDFCDYAQEIRKLKNNPQFYTTYGSRIFYGVVSFHKNESAEKDFLRKIKEIEQLEADSILFDSITFLSDASHCTQNQSGYQNLCDDDYLSLAVNTIFTIAITKRQLHTLANQQRRRFNTAGLFSFVYEPDAIRKEKAYHLAELLLKEFCTNDKDSDWCDENDAKKHLDNSSLKNNLHWHHIYTLLSQGFEEESMNGLFPYCDVSPWEMFSYRLIPLYFKGFVKSAIRKLYNNVHNFASLTLMRYEQFAKIKRQQLLEGKAEVEGKEQYAKAAIADYLSSVWSQTYEGAKGIKQVQLLLAKTKEYLEKQKKELARVKGFQEPNEDKYKGFPKITDYPLQEITNEKNKKYYSHYEELVDNGEPKAEFDVDANKSYEERLLTKIQKLFQWHAMPLNLFTKAGLLSVLIFVSVWSLISIIQATNLIHIITLDTNWNLIILFVVIALIVQTFAFLKYGQKILRKIRETIQEYIAWSYYKIQRELYIISLKEADEYYQALLKECYKVEKQLEEFAKLEVSNVPSYGQYKISKFQRNILGTLDNHQLILKDIALNIILKIGDTTYPVDCLASGIFTAMLAADNQNLRETMRNTVLSDNVVEKQHLKEELLKIWSDSLYEKIDVFINGQKNYLDIDMPAFSRGDNIGNFAIESVATINATIHPSVFVPIMRAYSYILSIVPNSSAPGQRWEALFYGPNMVSEFIPNYTNAPSADSWFKTKKITAHMRLHAYKELIVTNNENAETTIFNNQLIK